MAGWPKTKLGEPVSFKVKGLGNNVLPAKDMASVVAFRRLRISVELTIS
jgi:hypothetical protein